METNKKISIFNGVKNETISNSDYQNNLSQVLS